MLSSGGARRGTQSFFLGLLHHDGETDAGIAGDQLHGEAVGPRIAAIGRAIDPGDIAYLVHQHLAVICAEIR